MSPRAIGPLAALASLLALAIAAAWRPGTADVDLPLQRPVAAAQGAGVTAPGIADRQGWAAASLARPLFSPDRRPPAIAPALSGAPPPALPRLTGVLIDGTRRSVIFAAGEGGKPAVVAEGGELNGFRVQSIGAGEVTVVGPDGQHVLRPSFDPRPAAAAAQPVPGLIPGLPNLSAFTGIPGLPAAPLGAPR